MPQKTEFLIFGNITSMYKNRGEKSKLDNERNIFNLVTIRSILDKMIYKDNYEQVDASMSDSNVGASITGISSFYGEWCDKQCD